MTPADVQNAGFVRALLTEHRGQLEHAVSPNDPAAAADVVAGHLYTDGQGFRRCALCEPDDDAPAAAVEVLERTREPLDALAIRLTTAASPEPEMPGDLSSLLLGQLARVLVDDGPDRGVCWCTVATVLELTDKATALCHMVEAHREGGDDGRGA